MNQVTDYWQAYRPECNGRVSTLNSSRAEDRNVMQFEF